MRKILYALDFSVQRPRRLLARADAQKRRRWIRSTYPDIKKSPNSWGGTDPRRRSQFSPRLYTALDLGTSWSSAGSSCDRSTQSHQSVRFGGCVLRKFLYQMAEVFNAQSDLVYLERRARAYFPRPIFLVQDNASYHKDGDVWYWFKQNRAWLTINNLPPYCPELNATERLWHHTRITGTHNRYFVTQKERKGTLVAVFKGIQAHPEQIRGYLNPFC